MKIYGLIIAAACWFTQGLASSLIQVKQVIVGPVGGEKGFSLKVKILNQGETLKHWQFGFYMPRNFRQTSHSNRQLKLQICQNNSSLCTDLIYQRAPFTAADQSAVFTTIVAPSGDFPLVQGKSYTLSFLHNSSAAPHNYSSLPQSLFMVNNGKEIYNLHTTPASYQLSHYKTLSTRERNLYTWLHSAVNLAAINVIPAPQTVTFSQESGVLLLNQLKVLHVTAPHVLSANAAMAQAKLWQQAVAEDLGQEVSLDTQESASGICLQIVTTVTNPEGYQIQVTPQAIKVLASNPAGFFYALQTLRQLWYQQANLPLLSIDDAPRFGYRGILLDVARHYLTLAQLSNFIDTMAAAKLNTLHLHLSDDEGFRLDLAEYPQLRQIGAQRGWGQAIGPLALQQKNLAKVASSDELAQAETNYAGAYTQAEIKALISYANLRQITIIPEIDIPGHSRALMKALPASFYTADDKSEYSGYGDNALPVCLWLNKSASRFSSTLSRLIASTAELFNQQTTVYALNNEISLGGDEVADGTWDKSPDCAYAPWQKLSAQQKEQYFFTLLSADPAFNTLKFSGWHEFILGASEAVESSANISASKVGHVWVWGKSQEALRKAVSLSNNAYPVVLDYADYLYMDMAYSQQVSEPGFYWATKAHDTYSMLSAGMVASLTQQQSKNPALILGLEGALWTDVIPTYSQIQYMALPKIAGLAEASWSRAEIVAGRPAWQSLAARLGCGQHGFLAYLQAKYQVTYRGYPYGISREAPQSCVKPAGGSVTKKH